MLHEFPTILSPSETEETQEMCPFRLREPVILLFGITRTTGSCYVAEGSRLKGRLSGFFSP